MTNVNTTTCRICRCPLSGHSSKLDSVGYYSRRKCATPDCYCGTRIRRGLGTPQWAA